MPDTLPYNEKELLRRLAEGNEQAFTDIFNRYWNNIYSAAFAFTKSEQLAEDVLQETFFKLWQKRKEITALERLDNYLFVIAKNHILSEFKKNKIRQDYISNLKRHFDAVARTPEDQYQSKETFRQIEKAISFLPPQQQEVFRLSREKGYSHEEIANYLKISTHTVRNHMVRALAHIRQYLNKSGTMLLPTTIFIAFRIFKIYFFRE